ncbi:MAG: type I phosphomannose isomerase catalytic subunit [Limisphaerales bacterium]
MKLYPLVFQPIFKERLWGGRNLESLYGKSLPPGLAVGESWEISDRPGDESVVANGPLQGKSLRWLMEQCPTELLGPLVPMPARFPLLIKIIDAQAKLSLQVHPPAAVAAKLGGEPKTEMWYVAHAGPAAELFVGLKKGVSRVEFERKLAGQTVAECFHRIAVHRGDAMFLPSGRVHALGAETVIFEVQQNSDTTYRVFDWNRVDRGGKGRELHLPQSLASINFSDFEPPLLAGDFVPGRPGMIRRLVKNELFEVNLRKLESGEQMPVSDGRMQIVGVLEGTVRIAGEGPSVALAAGQFCLVPASCARGEFLVQGKGSFLQIYSRPEDS